MSCSRNVSNGIRSAGYVNIQTILALLTALPVKRQDIFGGVGQPESLIDKIVNFDEAVESYRAFDKGEVGKVIFSPWK